jgi:hypothetical protein
MRIHLNTDRAAAEAVIRHALITAKGAGRVAGHVYFDKLTTGNSRSHTTAADVHLFANCGDGKCPAGHRYANTGMAGADSSMRAASYDDWGWFLAELFDAHPDAKAGPYKGIDGFRTLAGRGHKDDRSHVYLPVSAGVPA